MKSRLGQTELQMQYAQLAVPGNCPEGIYMSMAESSDRLSGVIFIRKGYYQGSILHFDVSYPVNDINMAPAVHFAKGSVVHPLIDPSNDRLSIASAFPSWDNRAHNLTRLLYFIKGIFKTHTLDKLNEGLIMNAEAWRLYLFNRAVFSKLAAQCAVVSASPSVLYKHPSTSISQNDVAKLPKASRTSAFTFRQLSDEEMQEVRQAVFAD